MRSFLLFLSAMWLFARRAPVVEHAVWMEADAEQLAAFLATATGLRLQAMLRAEIAAANERAAMSQGSPIAAGWALGYRGLLSRFEVFSRLPEQEQEPEHDAFTVPAELAHLAP